MSFLKSGFSAIGRLVAVGVLAAAFLFGLGGVVYMSLQGTEVTVPEITGKDFSTGEKELALLGLKIKKRADRTSPEAPNTVIEQLPKPGETVKTGQMIIVVTSKGDGENGEKGSTLKKIADEDDSEKIEEMIDDKPKKAKSNSNTTRKKADTARDVSANTPDTNSSSEGNSNSSNSNKKEPGSNNNSTEKPNKNTLVIKQPNPGTRPAGEPRSKPATRP